MSIYDTDVRVGATITSARGGEVTSAMCSWWVIVIVVVTVVVVVVYVADDEALEGIGIKNARATPTPTQTHPRLRLRIIGRYKLLELLIWRNDNKANPTFHTKGTEVVYGGVETQACGYIGRAADQVGRGRVGCTCDT